MAFPFAAVGLFVASAAYSIFSARKRRSKTPVEDNYIPSSANRLVGQSNEARLGQRIPAHYGQHAYFPDLAAPSIVMYRRLEQTVTEAYVWGEGYYRFARGGEGAFRLGNTPIGDVSGAALKVFNPGTFPPNAPWVIRENINITDLRLPSIGEDEVIVTVTFAATNRIEFPDQDSAQLVAGGYGSIKVSGTANNDGIYSITAAPAYDTTWFITVDRAVTAESAVLSNILIGHVVGDHLVFAGQYGNFIRSDSTQLEGSYDWGDVDANGDPMVRTGWALSVGDTVMLDSTDAYDMKQLCVVSSVEYTTRTGITERDVDWSIEWAAFTFSTLSGVAITNLPVFVGSESVLISRVQYIAQTAGRWRSPWYRVGSDSRPVSRVVWDIGFPALYAQRAGKHRQAYGGSSGYSIREIVDGVPQQPITGYRAYADNVPEPVRWTHSVDFDRASIWELQAWSEFPTYQTTDGEEYVGEMHLYRVAGAYPIDWSKMEGVTILLLRLQSNQQIAQLKDRQLNGWAFRKLERVSISGGTLPGIRQTQEMQDAVLDASTRDNAGRLDITDLDLSGLFQIQKRMDESVHGRDLGEFNGTFDRVMPFREQLSVICEPARVLPFRRGSQMHFAREETDAFRNGGVERPGVALFNRRNCWNMEVEHTFKTDSDPDSVMIKWRDPSSDYQERTYRHPPTAAHIQSLDLGISGFGNWAQAYCRAVIEWRRVQLQRRSVTFTTYLHASMLDPFSKIRAVDQLRPAIWDGEAESYNSTTKRLTLRYELDPAPADTAELSVVLQRWDAFELDEIDATPVSGNPGQVVLARDPAFDVDADVNAQIGTLCSVGYRNSSLAKAWHLVEVAPVDAYSVRVTASQYVPSMFDSEINANIPAPPGDAMGYSKDRGDPW